MKIQQLPLSQRALLTFLPCLLIAPFDPLLAFCLFIVLFEKCIIAMLPLPGVEFTSLATFLFALKYDLPVAIFLALLVPGIIASIFKFLLWKEFRKPEEPPVTLGGGTVIDVVMVAICWYVKANFTLPLLELMIIFLLIKHALNYIKNTLTGSPDIMSPVVSSLLNIFLVLCFGNFFQWLLSA